MVKELKAFPMLEWCTWNLAMVRLQYPDGEGGQGELVVASSYFPGDVVGQNRCKSLRKIG